MKPNCLKKLIKAGTKEIKLKENIFTKARKGVFQAEQKKAKALSCSGGQCRAE